ncbi:MAG: hypothetical protein ACOCTM_00540 [Bacteroidota bacterium]
MFLLNKSVPTKERIEHKSFHWILNQERYVKSNRERYKLKTDYYGFFPVDPDKHQFDFRSIAVEEIGKISSETDIAYYADSYGVYYNDWYHNGQLERDTEQKVYGGLNQNDYLLLKALMEKGKTVITEFVLLNQTVSPRIREKTEDLLQLSWQGWIGRYFSSLNFRQNPEFPGWIVDLYENQNGTPWNFNDSGIVLIHRYGEIIVLESSEHLTRDVPVIHTREKFAENYQLPLRLEYPYWFDVVKADNTDDVVAHFNLATNAVGDSLLAGYNLTATFPAIIHPATENYTLYYFAGDFCDNPIYTATSYFSGIQLIDFLFYSKDDADRKKFFWKYYIPLMQGILEDTQPKANSS